MKFLKIFLILFFGITLVVAILFAIIFATLYYLGDVWGCMVLLVLCIAILCGIIAFFASKL
jgi:hypothetical protein